MKQIWSQEGWRIFFTGEQTPRGWTDACTVIYQDGDRSLQETFIARRVFPTREEAISSLLIWVPHWIREEGIERIEEEP